MERVERVWHRRLRWRLRGAWQWPTFVGLTLVDGILLTLLPPFHGSPHGVVPGILLAGFANLLAVAVVAPAAGRLLRRRRPDLPRLVATDYAGAWLLSAIAVLIVAAGLLHRSAVREEKAREQVVAGAMHDYVITHAPQYGAGLGAIDAIRIEPDYYRACVAGRDADHWFCLFVHTDRRPPAVKPDPSQVSNTADYRPYGGFD